MVQMIRHMITIHMKLVFLEAMMIVYQETCMQKGGIQKMINTLTIRQNKMIELILNHMKKLEKDYY